MIAPLKLPPVEEVAARINVPVGDWPGRCHEIAWRVRAAFDIDCRLCYGHWLGPVNGLDPPFAERKGLPFQRHGWLEMPDGSVVDPTRYVFEDVAPYVYVGPNDHYDEGGDRWRQLMEGVRPLPGKDAHPKVVPLKIADRRARGFVEETFGGQPAEELNLAQVFYLANMSRARLGAHARPVFQAIVDAGQGAAIPIDNRAKVLGEGPARKKRAKKPARGPTLFPREEKGPYEEGR